MEVLIRNEREEDTRAVEEVTREAFWNLYVPGCSEHYIVHTLRQHKDFIPELDYRRARRRADRRQHHVHPGPPRQ